MKRFDLHGSVSMSVDDVVRSLEASLSATFVERESAYLGVYFRLAAEGEEVLVQANVEDDEGYLLEPEFARWGTLVYVNGSDRWTILEQILRDLGLDLLRSETI